MKNYFKKLAAIMLALLVLVACGNQGGEAENKESKDVSENQSASEGSGQGIKKEDLKVGFIFLHDENSTYDKNFIDAANAAKKNLGLNDDQVLFKNNIPENSDCYEAAADLADRGCNIIFADSFGHEQYLAQVAQEFPNVQFAHATGTTAHTSELKNFHNAFASIYEGRYLAGVAAGMKLNELIEKGEITPDQAKMGYVGAYTYAEVISGYTSFYLGAKSVCPTVTMDVQFTGSWYDETLEKEAANMLISKGAVLISQHADSMGAPTACEQAGVFNVSYNGSTIDACPKTYITSSRIDWTPYFEHMINTVIEGKELEKDWVGGFDKGSVVLSDLNPAAAAPGTEEKLKEVEAGLKDGSIKVFDTKTFTVDGKEVTSYMADVDTDPNYEKDTEVIKDGAFLESYFRSAPYFDLRIDGITTLNEKM